MGRHVQRAHSVDWARETTSPLLPIRLRPATGQGRPRPPSSPFGTSQRYRRRGDHVPPLTAPPPGGVVTAERRRRARRAQPGPRAPQAAEVGERDQGGTAPGPGGPASGVEREGGPCAGENLRRRRRALAERRRAGPRPAREGQTGPEDESCKESVRRAKTSTGWGRGVSQACS